MSIVRRRESSGAESSLLEARRAFRAQAQTREAKLTKLHKK